MRSSKRKASAADVDPASDPFGVVAVRYLPRRDSIELAFASGGTMTVPRRALREFKELPLDAPKELVVSATGDALMCRSIDGEIAISGLVATVLGSGRLSAAFAQRGGRRTSKAKAAAARANGAKGGRPRNRSRR